MSCSHTSAPPDHAAQLAPTDAESGNDTVAQAMRAYDQALYASDPLVDAVVEGNPDAEGAWVPQFPVARLRAAIEAQDWDEVARVMGRYDAAVRASFDAFPAALQDRQAWREQLDMIGLMARETSLRREATERVLRSLTMSRRGASAYRAQMAGA